MEEVQELHGCSSTNLTPIDKKIINGNSNYFAEFDNVYCVAKGQQLTTQGVARNWEAVAVAEIRGNDVTFVNYYSGDSFETKSETSGEGNSGDFNNIMAAIVNGAGGYGVGWGEQTFYVDENGETQPDHIASGAQMATWYYWNSWVTSSGALEYGFTTHEGNAEVEYENGVSGSDVYNNAATMASTNTYNADIYFLKYLAHNNPKSNGTYVDLGNLQELIIVDIPEVPVTIDIPVIKIWDDDGDKYENRPDSIKVELLADGEKVAEATLSESNEWTYVFEDLDPDKTYEIREISVEGYEIKITGDQTSGFTITNKLPEINIPVEKVWQDNNNTSGKRPDKITVTLYENGVATNKTVELNAQNNWKNSFTELPKYKNGNIVTYTIAETSVEGYDTEITGDQTSGFTIINTSYEGYIEISGKVWVDRPDGKSNDINGVIDSDESGLEGITVILKDANGDQFDAHSWATTIEDGTYTIKVNYDTNSKVYKLHGDIEEVQEKLQTAYVEFVYDGMLYTTVNPLTTEEINTYNEQHSEEQITAANVSTAIENESSRQQLDNNYSTVTTTTTHPNELDETDKNITAKTENTIMSYYNDKTIEREETIKYCNGDGTYTQTNTAGAWNNPVTESHICTDANCTDSGHSMKKFNVTVSLIENVNLGLFKREQPDVAIVSDINDVFVTMDGQEYTYYYNKIINNPIESDLKAQFQDDNGTYTYRRPINPADIAYIQDKDLLNVLITYQVRVLNHSTTLPITVDSIINVYDSEYTIESIRKGTENPQEVAYTATTIYKDFAEETGSTKSTQFNEITLNGLNITVQPQNYAKSEDIIWITYSVSTDSIKGLLAKDATLSNAVEIHTYSTSYGNNTLYAEQRTHQIDKENGKTGRGGTAYAGYDYDSQPGNAGMYIDTVTYTYTHTDANGEEKQVTYNNVEVLKATNNEDDDYIAPSLILCKDEEKILSGNVWEDSSNQIALEDETYIRLGDGKNLDGTEKGLANAKVELYKVNDDGSISENPADLYKIEVDGEGNATRVTKPAIAYSDENGNYSFGGDGYSVVTDRYVIKFTYGEGIQKDESTISSTINNVNVNARNYKSTIIAEGTALYDVFKGVSNEEWHLNIGKGYSVAVDDINVRLGITDLQYSNFEDKINMVAYSKPFKMQVEFNPNQDKESEVNDYGTTQFGHDLSVFDFGIVERARENIVVNKTVDYMYFRNGLDQTVTQGNPETDSLNYVSVRGFGRENTRTATDKQLILEYDAELIHNSEIDIRYEITVENNSEVEFDYYLEDTGDIKTEYYYFGEYTESDPKITSSVNYLVDYIDRDVSYTLENPENWEKIELKDLWTENGTENLISNESADYLDPNKYDIYITTMYSNLAPGQKSEPQYANATKTLTNDGDNVIENHIEILQIDGKSARTIKETVDGTIISKEYRPGNYVPSTDKRITYDSDGLVTLWNNTKAASIDVAQAGIHEQDDDRVKIVITPGTGVTKYITTYIIAGVIGLIVIVIGVIFIKKKVLTR